MYIRVCVCVCVFVCACVRACVRACMRVQVHPRSVSPPRPSRRTSAPRPLATHTLRFSFTQTHARMHYSLGQEDSPLSSHLSPLSSLLFALLPPIVSPPPLAAPLASPLYSLLSISTMGHAQCECATHAQFDCATLGCATLGCVPDLSQSLVS